MPELGELLAEAAVRYEIRPLPVEEVRRRRQRRMLARAGGALAVLAVVGAVTVTSYGAGPARDSTVVVASGGGPAGGPRVEGLRTDPDGRALVATYTGGACDGPADLLVEEHPDRVQIAVRVQPGPGGDDGVCPAIAIGGSVSAGLAAPLGDRVVLAGHEVLTPFDGVGLLVPGRLPAGSVLRSETGRREDQGWTRTFGRPDDGALGGGCSPQDRSLAVSTGPRVHAGLKTSYFRDAGEVAVGDGVGCQYVQDGGAARYLALEVGGAPVALFYGADCGGSAPSAADLVQIAECLRPARP